MSISKKLYVNFGAVLLAVVVLFAVIVFAVHHEQSAKGGFAQALEMQDTTDNVRFQIMQNRLYLSNYLLSGDSREVDRMNDGIHQLTDYCQNVQQLATTEQQRTALEDAGKNEIAWVGEFAQPMLQKRKEVHPANTTTHDLKLNYF